ncbi:hypothetical protein H8M03_10105 [Sphingomonas sabuli]|uniref:Uncharacterized protein n=1 Tax=Sphingomonas sabuli TaxID=2764186 RepID=A0A7G9L161_9SPHN|nr:hypothetical protein [Sphingomonas sabuli]QNM82360.1 hypothetical protein H8M03_10105 [Sphingomonas sabuli]
MIIAVVALIIAVATGFLDISQTRSAQAPDLSVNGASVTAKGGQTPAFDVETGSVSVGTRETNVAVPNLRVNPPDQPAATQADNSVSNEAF